MATNYIVLRRMVEQGAECETWNPLDGSVEAHTPQAAIRAATDGKPATERSGTFVAVPARSWKPVTRTVDTREVDVWG